jgi:Uma2 family endonuclease
MIGLRRVVEAGDTEWSSIHMATHPARRGWSYAEFARLPDDGKRYEVIDGELYVTPSPTSIHQQVSLRLAVLFAGYCETRDAGIAFHAPYDVILGEGDYVVPDLLFVRRDRERFVIRADAAVGPPDLLVEILSPSTAGRDKGVKRDRYAAYGVAEYWIVDTDAKRIEVYRLTGGELASVAAEDDLLRYRPMPDGPELVIDVPHLMRPVSDHTSRSRA